MIKKLYPYSLILSLEKMNVALDNFSEDSCDSTIPEGAIIIKPSGENVRRLKND